MVRTRPRWSSKKLPMLTLLFSQVSAAVSPRTTLPYTAPPTRTTHILISFSSSNVNLLLHALHAHPRPNTPLQHLRRTSIHALRSILRLHGRQNRTLATKILPDGPRTRFPRRPDFLRRRARLRRVRCRDAHPPWSYLPDILRAMRIDEVGEV